MPQDYWTIATAIPLVLCSVIALALIIERTIATIQLRGLDKQQDEALTGLIDVSDLAGSMELISEASPFYQRAADSLIEYRKQEKALRDEAVTLSLEQVGQKLLKRLSAINTIGALAPMLGLLGTIIGLMRSFHDIGLSKGPVEPAVVADGLWQALSTTAAGMVIAVFCVFFSALLRSSATRKIGQAATTLTKLSLLMATTPEIAKEPTKEPS